MILRSLARTHRIVSHICGRRLGWWSFASGEKLLAITNKLVLMDSVKLEKVCQDVLESYVRPVQLKGEEKKDEGKRKKKGKSPQPKQLEQVSKALVQQDSISQDILYLYKTFSDAKIGFLKGDIHPDFIFKLNKYLSQKNPKQLPKDLTLEQYKKMLIMATELKNFRLPKRGIKDSSMEDQKNLLERQLLLEIVSNQLSTSRFDNILDSLAKMNKLHLSSAFNQYSQDWLRPFVSAIQEEQNKCQDEKNLTGNRKIYASEFKKLPAEKVALLCISQVLKRIISILYKDFERKQPRDQLQFDQREIEPEFYFYDSIRYKDLCVTLARWVSVQSLYEEKQRQFRMVMKMYDTINLTKNQQRDKILARKKKEGVSGGVKADGQAEVNPLDQQQRLLNENYRARMKQIEQTHNQRYIPSQDRKKYLQDIRNKLLKQQHRIKSEMPEEVQSEIGQLLIYMMRQIIKIKNKTGYRVPLLTLEHKYIRKGKEIVYDKRLRLNDYFLEKILPVIEKEGDLFMHLERSIPTMVPPLPWVQYEIGGYYLYPTAFMRFSNCKLQERLIRYSDLSRVFGILNSLASTPWKINKKVLGVVEAIWAEGGQAGSIPKRYSQVLSTYLTKLKTQKNFQTKKQLQRKIQTLRDQHSLRSDFNLKLNLALSFSKLDRFFYPHNVDFRGRVYPIPPHLNHIGNDLSRGLLLFADGKRLGESGVRWLKIHCANLMGKDKATIEEKLEFVQANLGLIHAIAEDPLGNREWLSNQDCWQSLAAIFQLSAALKSENPEEYISYLHVHQDGSCNGLQHYAALGRDTEGAYQVNLGPNERPGDVYTYVANMVIKAIDGDIANPQSKDHELAKKLRGQIKRKTIKQTVMTSVYGVTFIGARDQIFRQLKDQHFLKDDDQEFKASTYVAKLTLDAIANLFSGAHQIKKWLINCARVVASQGNPIGWITPVGLPVVQPYRKESSQDKVSTVVHSLKMANHPENLPVNQAKQKSAFPPNFVHSLDSTHMMYTAERCTSEGITFAAVHDSYWTHAASVERMNQILREQFIRLHSENLLEGFKASLEIRYPGLQFPEIPKRGDFDLEKIKKSIYFFS